MPSTQSRDALPRFPCPPGSRGPKDSVPFSQPSSLRRALCNRPARPGRHREGPSAGGSLARSLRDKRPLHLLPLVPIPTTGGSRTRRPKERTASAQKQAPVNSGKAERRPQPRQTAEPHAALRPPGHRQCSPASSSHCYGWARTGLSRALSRQTLNGAQLAGPRPLRSPHPCRAATTTFPRRGPGERRGSGRRGRAWRRAAAGPEQAASLERPTGLPLPQATELANRLSPTSSASITRVGAAPPALLTEAREHGDPGGEGRTAAKPETDTAAILGPARCSGGRGGARWNSPRGEGGGEATEQRGGTQTAAGGRCGAAAAPPLAARRGRAWSCPSGAESERGSGRERAGLAFGTG